MGDRADELRRAIARERRAGAALSAMASKKAARARLFEEGITEQLRLRRRLLADRAGYLEEIDRVEKETMRAKADLDAAKAAASGRGRRGRGRGRKKLGRGGAPAAPT